MNLEQIKHTTEFLRQKGITQPEIGIVLGTGLGNLATKIEADFEIDYEEIPNFPVSTVEMHKGKLIYGKIGGKQVLAMQGRFHYYEGYSMEETVFPIRVMKLLGVKSLLISNAAGAINLDFQKGDLMLITDHVNLFPANPLLGQNEPELGTRFPDMSEPYSKQLNAKLRTAAQEKGITLREGVYVTAQGPMLETPAEYRMLKIVGGDAVGMSTVPEVIAANHIGLPCCAVSVLTDECDPDNLKPVDIAEIIEVAGKAELKLTELFIGLIDSI
ncbi:MAG: purine-nucleoside phosphorylase [Flavobacteriales bacterium]|jgi:purine-nucleoside phosphorylase|nr:purine-nucleoside phosphorylase [Flavobacteriales bacterium]